VVLLDALVPLPPEGSLYGWVAKHGLALMNGDSGVIARAESGRHGITLQVRELALAAGARDLGQVRMLVASEKRIRASGELVDVVEQEVFFGRIGIRAYRLPAPDVASPPLADWLVAWRAYVARRLARLLQELRGALPMPIDVLSGRTPFHLIQFWLEEGPLPSGSPPRLRIAASSLERALTRVRAVSLPSLRARLRGRGLPTIQAALSLGPYTIVLCAGNRPERIGDDRVLLLPDGGEPITLLRSDDEPQNRLKYTLDGDAGTLRRVLGWLSDLFVRAGLDREIELRYLGSVDRRPLSRWLGFKGDNHDPDEPVYDPRLDLDLLVDDHPYWDSSDCYLPPPPPAEQERLRREHVPRYYAFLREVLDPSFVGRLEQASCDSTR
jgi:hypothetical protein